MATEHPMLSARRWHDALVAAGVVRDGESIHRIVIDAQARDVVKIYVERYGDERLLSVVPTLDGVEITATAALGDDGPLNLAGEPIVSDTEASS